VVRGPASPEPARTLSEHASKTLLASYGIPIAREALASSPAEAVAAAEAIGFPVAVKLCGDAIAHKTERDLVRLGLADAEAVRRASQELLAKRRPEDGKAELLVCEMVHGRRELIAGLKPHYWQYLRADNGDLPEGYTPPSRPVARASEEDFLVNAGRA